jgi:hypothetical protein
MHHLPQHILKSFAVLALAACGGTGPSDVTPGLGRYEVAYTYTYGGVFGGTFTGDGEAAFEVTSASAAKITGHSFGTDGGQYEPLGLGEWNGDAYAVWVVTQHLGGGGPTLRLRLNRAGTTCTGRIAFLNGSNYALDTCQLSR